MEKCGRRPLLSASRSRLLIFKCGTIAHTLSSDFGRAQKTHIARAALVEKTPIHFFILSDAVFVSRTARYTWQIFHHRWITPGCIFVSSSCGSIKWRNGHAGESHRRFDWSGISLRMTTTLNAWRAHG